MAFWRIPRSFGGRTNDFCSKCTKKSFFLLSKKKKKRKKEDAITASKKNSSRRNTYQRHLIRKGYDYRITLIYSIQYVFRRASLRFFTLMAQAIAKPIPSTNFSKLKKCSLQSKPTGVARCRLNDHTLPGRKFPFLLSSFHHCFRNSIFHRTSRRHEFNFSHYIRRE